MIMLNSLCRADGGFAVDGGSGSRGLRWPTNLI